jgi:hypothetical protein
MRGPSPGLALLNAGEAKLSPAGMAMHAGSTGMHIAQRAGSGAAQRSAQPTRNS